MWWIIVVIWVVLAGVLLIVNAWVGKRNKEWDIKREEWSRGLNDERSV